MLAKNRPFSWGWMLGSMVVFVLAQVVLTGLVGQLFLGRYMAHGLREVVQGLLYLLSYFAGGFLIGVISPGVRLLEPALGAFLSIFLIVFVAFVMPNSYLHFQWLKMILGGLIAFGLALYGATLGEKLTRQL